MSLFDWGFLVVFLVLIVGVGIYSMRYVRSVTDFLVCGMVSGNVSLSDKKKFEAIAEAENDK